MYRGYARIATEELKQNALAQRTQELTKSRTDVARIGATSRVQAAGITGKSRTDAASIAAKAKVDAANIAKDAKGKSPDQLQLKILDSQLKSYTQLKKNADDNYEKMMKEDKPEVAQIYKQMSSGYDSQISSINTQMDDLKSVGDMSEFNKMIQDIIGPDSEATDPPEDSDASDNN
jgi:F0F1-type ATP synthase membrane subunit b/b'